METSAIGAEALLPATRRSALGTHPHSLQPSVVSVLYITIFPKIKIQTETKATFSTDFTLHVFSNTQYEF
jgi:hypothetical protein